jgi:hypothetical protein
MSSGHFQSPGLQATRGLGEMQNGERRSRGSQWCAHQRGRQTGAAGFWRGAVPGGSLSPCRGGSPRVLRRREVVEDCGSASRCSWRPRLAPVGLHAGKPRKQSAVVFRTLVDGGGAHARQGMRWRAAGPRAAASAARFIGDTGAP